MPTAHWQAYADAVSTDEGATFASLLEAALGALAVVSLVVAVVVFVAWIAAPRVGVSMRRTRMMLRIWIAAVVIASVLGLLGFIIGRDVARLF